MLNPERHADATFLDLLGRLGTEFPKRALLTEIVDALRETLDAERVFLFRFRKSGGIRVVVARNLDGEDLSRPQSRMSHHAVRKMEASGDIWVVENARQDRRYRSEDVIGGRKSPRSIVLFPLRLEGGVAGGLYADHRFQKLDGIVARSSRVEAWVGLCAAALALREQETRIRWLAKKLESKQRHTALSNDWASAYGRVPRRPLSRLEASAKLEEFCGVHSANPDLRDRFDDLRNLRDSTIPVLIRGETGVGKNRFARAVHRSSSRGAAPLVTVGCGSIPDTLIESELLGHMRGAFTGADADREGMLVSAHGGTLFLDEVSDLSLEMQTKLLRILEDGKVRPIGAKEPRDVDIRIVTATADDLERRVREGRFRGDLYFRLRGVEMAIGPLRERWEDIPGLIRLFFEQYGEPGSPPHVHPAALERFLAYSWPGNVRELENEIRRLAALGHVEITEDVLAPFLRAGGDTRGDALPGAAGIRPLDDVVSVAERDAIVAALRHSGGNKSRAADRLRITRKALYRRLAKYGIGGQSTTREEEAQ